MSQFLSIVWQGEPLQYLIIILFGGAFFIESYSTFQYCNKELKNLANFIEFLQKNQSSRKLNKNIVWLRENVAGTINTDGESFSPDKQDKLYVFTQYPAVLSRAVPRSFLRFIPTAQRLGF
jgi:hypothetical protein